MSRIKLFFCSLLSFIALTATAVPSSTTQDIRFEPAAPITPQTEVVLSIDDGTPVGGLGGNGNPGFGWFNLLKPDSYPATLKEVVVAFNNSSRGVRSGSPFRIVVYVDPEADGPSTRQEADILFGVTSNSPGTFERYTLPRSITIDRGAFVVGVLDPIFVAELPAFFDQPGTIQPAGSRSFFTLDNGATFSRVSTTFPGFGIAPGSWLIRAVVDVANLQPVVTRAFYRKNKLRIVGRNFSSKAVVRINGERITVPITFKSDSSRFIIKGTSEELNLNPTGQSNRLVVIIDGVASEVFEFST